MMSNYFDIYTVGVGGQGILTISDIITQAAVQKGLDVNYYPSKGMAQRGGFVRSQVRLGRKQGTFSPSISPAGSDLVVSMELSETLKAIRFAKKDADFVILGLRWLPADVMMGDAPYPETEAVLEEIRKAGGKPHYFDPAKVPAGMRPNLYALGAVCANSRLLEFLSKEFIEEFIANKWKKVAEANLATFRAGFDAAPQD